jgi:hypothetical protein
MARANVADGPAEFAARIDITEHVQLLLVFPRIRLSSYQIVL